MGTADGLTALHINGGLYGIAHFNYALSHMAIVHEFSALILLYICNCKGHPLSSNNTVVTHLTAHLRIERGLVQHYNAVASGLHLAAQLIVAYQRHHSGIACSQIIPYELGGGNFLAELHTSPAQITQRLAGLTGTLLLLLHQLAECLLVHRQALVGGHLGGQVNGESEGVVQLEGIGTREHGLALSLMLSKHLAEDAHTAVNGTGKALLLCADDLRDIGLFLPQVGILALILMDDGIHYLIQERIVDAQKFAVAGRAAQQAAKHITPPLIGGQDAVTNHKCCGADVIGDDTQGYIPLLTLAIECSGKLGDLIGDVHHGVHIEQGVHILAHNRQTLQTHTGVNIFLLQLGVIVVAVVVELGEHIVPDLNVAVAIASYGAVRLAAAELLTTVVVDLGAGATGAGAVLPEVVRLAKAEDLFLGDADLLVPDVKGLVIIQIHRGIQTVFLQTHYLGQKLPAPCNGLVLEVIAEREIAQHLKIGAVAGSVAHIVNIAGADALLAGADPAAGRLFLSLEPGLHGGHSGVDEQDGFVILGYQRKAGQAQMVFALKVAQEHFPQLIESMIGVRHS